MFEEVEFVKIPKKNTWFSKKIIDFSLFNVFSDDFSGNGRPINSILKGIVKNISKVLGEQVYSPTYDGGEFSVSDALNNGLQAKLIKESTDYAKAILGNHSDKHIPKYRQASFSDFSTSPNAMPYYNKASHQFWWIATQHIHPEPRAFSIDNTGSYQTHDVNFVLGVVICIK